MARPRWPQWCLQGVIAGLMGVWALADFLVRRGPGGYDTLWDGWVYNIAQTLPAVPVLLGARRSARLRWAWSAVGAAIVLNTAGNLTSRSMTKT